LRIAVTADLHLRAISETPMRFRALEEILKSMSESKIALLVIAGDLFDQDVRDYSDFEALAGRPEFAGIRMLAIPGNHDPGLRQNHFTLRNMRVIQSPTVLRLSEGDRALAMIPYGSAPTFSDAMAKLSTQSVSGSILIGHGDFVAGRAVRPNPYESGFYMPLTRRDLDAGHLPMAVLGHIHSPISFGDVHYPGSPCPVDRSETGMRSYLQLDLATGGPQRTFLHPGLLFLSERVAVVPGPGEVRLVKESLSGLAARNGIPETDRDAVQVSLELVGFAESREAVAEAARLSLSEAFGRKDHSIDLSGLRVADDPLRAALAAETFRRLKAMRESGDWPAGSAAPDVSAAAEKALALVYGVK